jgi:hypothetical protein
MDLEAKTIEPKLTPGAEVYVLESEAHVLVRPACVALHTGETLRVYNFTGGDLRVYIPAAGSVAVCIPATGSDLTVPIARPGVYHYAVFCEKQAIFAEGESSPKIIIKP